MLAAAVILAAGLGAESRTAEAKCWPQRTPDSTPVSRFDGRLRLDVTPTGVRSYILNYSPWVWFGSNVSAWVMLQGPAPEGQWAQVGWIEWQGDERATVAQYTPINADSGYVTAYFPAQPLGSSTEYRVLFRTNDFQFFYNDVSLGYGAASWRPNVAFIAGETQTLASQMPGGSNSSYSEWFSLSQVEYGGWGGWYYFAGQRFPQDTRYFDQQIYNSWTQRIWDKACIY